MKQGPPTAEEVKEAQELAKAGKPLTKRQFMLLDRQEQCAFKEKMHDFFLTKIRNLDAELTEVEQMNEPFIARVLYVLTYIPAYVVASVIFAFRIFKDQVVDILAWLEGEE